jgi:ketosteroid isomerase-like protein
MKAKYLLIILVGLLSSFTTLAQSKDEQAIRKVMNKQVNAWNSGDIDAFMTTYWKNDSLLFVGSKGPIYGWQTTLDSYKKSYPDTVAMGKLNFEILRIEFLSYNYSFVLGKWHLTRSLGDIGGYFTLLFRKIKKQWVIVADHTSK